MDLERRETIKKMRKLGDYALSFVLTAMVFIVAIPLANYELYRRAVWTDGKGGRKARYQE